MTCKFLACSAIAALLLLVACGKDSSSPLRSVESLEARGDYAAAIAELTADLRAQPQNSVLRYHLGRMYILQFDGVEAERQFRKANESRVVEGGRVVLGLARALLQQRKYQEVITDVMTASAFERSILASIHALRAHALMSLERFGEAKKELDAAVSVDPQNADVVLLRARFKAEERDIAGALELVEKLVAQHPGNVDAWLHRADLLTLLDRPRQALESFTRILDIRPRHLDAMVGRAIVLIQVGRLVDAQKDVDVLRIAYRKRPESAYLRGQIYYWRGEYREALDMAQAALKSDGDYDPARLLSGMANLMLDSPAQAEHELARYLAQEPRDDAVRRVLRDLHAQVGQGDRKVKVLGSEHADGLRKASVQALCRDAYVATCRHSRVADWLEEIADASLPDPSIVVRQARRRFSKEQLELAALDLERIVAFSDAIKRADTALVLVQLARSDTTKALDAVSMMERKSPNSPHADALAGIVLMERNERDEARRRFDDALRRDPKLMSAVLASARLDLAMKNPDLARKRFQNVLRSDPDHLQALLMYALLEESARRYGEAHDLLKRAVAAHPKALEPKALLVGLLRKENAKARALVVAEEVLAAHPENPIAIELAADIQLWSGDYERGLATLERLVAVLPRSPESFFKLARAQATVGRKVEADRNLVKALALPVDDPEIRTLPGSGLFDDSGTLEAIESIRKSYGLRVTSSQTALRQLETWPPHAAESTFYDALSGR